MIDDVGQQQAADSKLLGEARQIEARRLLGQRPSPLPVGEILRSSAEPLEDLRGDFVALRMDPGGVERIAAIGDLEESGRLDMGRLTESRHLEELGPAGEGAVLRAPFLEALGHCLVEPRDVAEERGAGGVGIDTDVVHAAFHHRVERGIQMPGLHVVLIEPNADVRRLDLHQFRKRILKTTANRNRTPDRGLVVGEFLTGVGARRIDARPRLVDDAVGDVGLLEGAGDQFSDEGLGFPTGRAITDRDHVHAMFLDELDDPCAGCLALLLLADDRQHGMLQRHPTLVDHDRLAAALESGVEGEHPLATDRGLEEKIPQIAGKHGNGVPLAVFRDLPADLPLEAREHKSSDGVTGTSAEEIGVRMGRIDQEPLGRCLHLVDRTLDPHLQQPGPFTTIDR